MTRREAIHNIFLASAGIALMPGCKLEDGPFYANVPLERGQRTFIELMTNALLPRDGTEIQTPESTTDFILTTLNDCTAPEDIQQYLLGIKEFQKGIVEKYQKAFKRLDTEKQLELFSEMGSAPGMTEAARYFFNTTNNLTRRHFTVSEYFMKNVLEFEFAPGRYVGCKPIQ